MKKLEQLRALERIARIKADLELKKFAAFSQHMTQAQRKAEALQMALMQSYRGTAPLSLSEARMANAQAGRSARELKQAERDILRLQPKFEAARKDAAKEFGRAEVLLSLAAQNRRKGSGDSA
ncbi:hypothetical protein H4P12_08620 [Paracoccus sp. 11-3]|uniref:Uncharacterized protein n=1 Tax=Paracoccus amoyensis TaxID=2760093 RepID=A0A926JCV0_9RHOB|nr:hypothetical protein [Paracoccus amoyensis]MBC9246774.1 hypothetical protein [Paracoccus amoyensis]